MWVEGGERREERGSRWILFFSLFGFLLWVLLLLLTMLFSSYDFFMGFLFLIFFPGFGRLLYTERQSVARYPDFLLLLPSNLGGSFVSRASVGCFYLRLPFSYLKGIVCVWLRL